MNLVEVGDGFEITAHVASDGTIHYTRTLTEAARQRQYAEMITYVPPAERRPDRQGLYLKAIVGELRP